MASVANPPALAERSDVHKSCKSIETLLNILNEYCEAAGTIFALQKKLSKALRDTASLKTTGEIAGNAMNASANIFEALSEVDSKFAKFADKEYDFVSTEVKKWFKKLSKEEKNHDERMANANAKIKQAGQLYEKKSKKKATDASDEHARYIGLISTLGPEISQEKYNHALNVTQRHNAATYGVAASLSRLADSEWQRSFECVRRFSPTIGQLGQWRALCEGGWTGPIPPKLPDLDGTNKQLGPSMENDANGLDSIVEEAQPQSRPRLATPGLAPESRQAEQPLIPPPGYSTGPPSASASMQDLPRDRQASSHSGNSPTLTRQSLLSRPTNLSTSEIPAAPGSPTLARQNPSPGTMGSYAPEVSAGPDPPTNLAPPRPGFVDANTGSVRSLSAFPSPPTHYPIPPPRQPQPQRQQSALSQSLQSTSSNLDLPYGNRPMSDSPVSGNSDNEDSSFRNSDQDPRDHLANANVLPVSPGLSYRGGPVSREAQPSSRIPASATEANEAKRPVPVKSHTSLPQETDQRNFDINPAHQGTRPGGTSTVDFKSIGSKPHAREDDSREFGILAASDTAKARTTDSAKYSRPLEPTDTGTSSGSLVAAMRHRYSSNSGSISPPPRDLPRLPLPLSVNDLTARYQSSDVPLSPRARVGSPPVMRQQSLPLLDTSARPNQAEAYQDRVQPGPTQPKGPSAEDERWRRQQQRIDFDEAERRAKEQELNERERELERRAQELERDRVKIQTLRIDKDRADDAYRASGSAQPQDSQLELRPRERRTSFRQSFGRPTSQIDGQGVADRESLLSGSATSPNLRQKYDQGATRLAPPSPSAAQTSPSSTRILHSPKPGYYSPLPTPMAESPYESRDRDRYPDTDYNSNTTSTNNSSHASNCGCEACSVSKYKAAGTPSSSQQTVDRSQNQRADSKPEKSKSWMRRLSMPVGSAFSLGDSKRQQNNGTGTTTTNYSLGSGVGHTPSGGSRGLFSIDGRKNSSTTALSLRPPDASTGDRGLGRVQEDGRLAGGAAARRSYEASGISNRSMTNLGLTGRP